MHDCKIYSCNITRLLEFFKTFIKTKTDNKAVFLFFWKPLTGLIDPCTAILRIHLCLPSIPPWPSPARSLFLSPVSLTATIFSWFLFKPSHYRLHNGPMAPGLIRKTPPGRRLSRRPKLHHLDEINFREQTVSLRKRLSIFHSLNRAKSHIVTARPFFLIVLQPYYVFPCKCKFNWNSLFWPWIACMK